MQAIGRARRCDALRLLRHGAPVTLLSRTAVDVIVDVDLIVIARVIVDVDLDVDPHVVVGDPPWTRAFQPTANHESNCVFHIPELPTTDLAR